MSSTTTRTPARPGGTRHDASSAPTVGDVRTGLQQSLGTSYDAVWAELCDRLRVQPDVASLAPDQLDRLLDQLSQHDPLCRVLAMSWRIRCTASRKLAAVGR